MSKNTRVCQCPEEGIESPKAEVASGCEPQDMDDGKWTRVLCKGSQLSQLFMLVFLYYDDQWH